MTYQSSVQEQIRAMGMTEKQTRAAIQDFERAEMIVELLFRSACSIRKSAAKTGAVLRRLILDFSH